MEPGRGTFDRDFDSRIPRPPPHLIEPVETCQRLVANPFLTVLCWVVALGLVNESIKQQNLALLMMAIILVFVAFFFLQFHCLDCGATGFLLRSWAHACPAVVARRQSQVIRRLHGPGLKTQLTLWFIVMTAALVLGMVAFGTSR